MTTYLYIAFDASKYVKLLQDSDMIYVSNYD